MSCLRSVVDCHLSFRALAPHQPVTSALTLSRRSLLLAMPVMLKGLSWVMEVLKLTLFASVTLPGEGGTTCYLLLKMRGPEEEWGVVEGKRRRIKNLTDGSENEPGEWNTMVIECEGRAIRVWVNGDKVNEGRDCTADSGSIAIQAEGAEVEIRRLELSPLDGHASVR